MDVFVYLLGMLVRLVLPSCLALDDFSRIRLKQIEDVPGSDYINACYVDVSLVTDIVI